MWIVDSAHNMPVVQRLWRESTTESHLNGITSFQDSASFSPEDALLGVLDTIDLHHGIHSANPPYTVLEIVGTPLTANLKNKLVSFGFDEFQTSSGGFVAQTRPRLPR